VSPRHGISEAGKQLTRLCLRPEICLTKGSIRTHILTEPTQIYAKCLSVTLPHFSTHTDRISGFPLIFPNPF